MTFRSKYSRKVRKVRGSVGPQTQTQSRIQFSHSEKKVTFPGWEPKKALPAFDLCACQLPLFTFVCWCTSAQLVFRDTTTQRIKRV